MDTDSDAGGTEVQISGGSSDEENINGVFEPDVHSMSSRLAEAKGGGNAGVKDAPPNEIADESPIGVTDEAQAVAPPTPEMQAPSTEQPTDWMQQLYVAQMQGQQHMAQQMAMMQQQAQQQQAQYLQLVQGMRDRRDAQDRAARLDASKPKPPNPETGTVADWQAYNESYAQWAMSSKSTEIRDTVQAQLGAFKDVMTKYISGIEASRQQDAVRQQEQVIHAAVANLSQHPQYAFLRDPAFQTDFFQRWYMMNQAAGTSVHPEQVAQGMAQIYARYNQITGKASAVSAAQKIDAVKVAEQQRRGAPRTMRQGASGPDNSQQDKIDKLGSIMARFRGAGWADRDIH